MNNERVSQLMYQVERLIPVIVDAARRKKTVEPECLRNILSLLDELSSELKDVQVVKKEMVGTLWYPFTALLAEADHAQDPGPLLDAAWEIKERLSRIFGPLARDS